MIWPESLPLLCAYRHELSRPHCHLSGTLSGNDSTFTISTLIIPKQRGTSDTVEMLSEEVSKAWMLNHIDDYSFPDALLPVRVQDVLMIHLEKELYPLGWIHTHPTQVSKFSCRITKVLEEPAAPSPPLTPILNTPMMQTCFLSSVDVHTQSGYQTMLDEAVAIVMAPTDRTKRCGIFRLTTPGGLTLVQKCDRRGFHMHPETSTGQEVYELCGHMYLNDRVKHEVIDLR